MGKLQELIARLCPDGVPFRPIWELTIWDKRFNGVERKKQPKVINYPYLLAKDMKALERENGDVRLLSTGEYEGWTTEEVAQDFVCEGEIVSIPWGGTVKGMKYYKGKFVTADNRIATSSDIKVLNNKFLYYIFLNQSEILQSFYRGAGIQHPNMNDVLHMLIPVPPIEVQEEIVKILDRFADYAAELQAELQARKEQYEYYRNLLLTFNPSAYGFGTDDEQKINDVTIWGGHSYNIAWKPMGEIGTFIRGKRFVRTDIVESGTPCIHYGDMYTHYGLYADKTPGFLSDEIARKMRYAQKNDIVIVAAGENKDDLGNALAWLGDEAAAVHDACFIFKSEMYPNFVSHVCRSLKYHKQVRAYANEAKICSVSGADLAKVIIPVPDYELQIKIASILDRFEELVNDLTKGLPAEIAAVKERYEYFRNKLLTFKKIA